MSTTDRPTPATPGLLVVISGPSGVGKTTIVRAVKDRLGGMFSVSATTRPRTEMERHGVDYYFLSEEEFVGMLERGELLEHAEVFGRHWYGTPRRPVVEALAAGRLVILEIDVQGALQVKQGAPDAFMVFIEPPDEETLLARLRARGRDDEDAIARRFAEARSEIALARESGRYDVFIVNDDLERAQRDTCARIAERRGEVASVTGS
ncbi:MAG: guanylate kinase [Phycisphaerales bacterium]|nr:guanylate kinase [Phycisphaerales bacterium]NNM25694.1 guanylate kinase [Phycisphaerales bacterium]